VPFLLAGCAAIVARLISRKAASRCLIFGLLGSFAGIAIAPLAGVLVGSVASIMVEPRYFIHRFVGCISPFAIFLAYTTLIAGALLGCAGGAYIAIRRRGSRTNNAHAS